MVKLREHRASGINSTLSCACFWLMGTTHKPQILGHPSIDSMCLGEACPLRGSDDGAASEPLGTRVRMGRLGFNTPCCLLLWRDEIRSHHFKPMVNHCLVVFTGQSSFYGFSGDECHGSTKRRNHANPKPCGALRRGSGPCFAGQVIRRSVRCMCIE